MVYVINVVLILMYGVFCRYLGRINRKKIFLGLCVFQLTMIVGLRNDVGADFRTYRRIYEELAAGYLSYSGARLEWGYRFLNVVFSKINMPFWTLNCFVAFITHFFLAKALYKLIYQFEYIVLAMYLYISFFFMYHSMNMTRQGMAMCIGLYGIALVLNNRTASGILCIGVASSFHLVALVYLLVFFLKNIEINKKTLWFYVVASLLAELSLKIVTQIISYSRYSLYLDSYYNKSFLNSSFLNLLVRGIMMCLVLVLYKRIADSAYKNTLYNMIVICTIIQGITVQSSIFGRVTTYFFIAYVVLIPFALSYTSFFGRKLDYYAVVTVATIYHCVYYVTEWKAVLVNSYKSIF